MAASSPAKSSGDVVGSPGVALSSKNLRGLNKPKCIKCGNVARSRCPYQSCKNCCAKAQNPCHIHVLKGNLSFPDKPPSTNSLIFDQQSSEVSHPGNFQRLRQLSSNFTQFSNLQTSFRSRKPLTKKDAQVINEWRFLKLKEFKDGNIEAESEAFDRYPAADVHWGFGWHAPPETTKILPSISSEIPKGRKTYDMEGSWEGAEGLRLQTCRW